MKKIVFLSLLSIAFISAIFITNSCAKEKTPVSILSSNCPDTIKFSQQILPMMSTYCFSCHNAGTLPEIKDYTTVFNNASAILNDIRGTGQQLMPQGGPALHDSLIQQFSCWIDQGKMNN